MVKVGFPFRPARETRLPKTPLAWFATCLLGLLVAVLFLDALLSLFGGASYLWHLASEATVFTTWSVLHIVLTVLALIAVVGSGMAAWRLRLVTAFLFVALPVPVTLVIAGSGCHTHAACQAMGWAALPPSAFEWQVRIRPVTDRNEAERIAWDALSQASLEDRPFQAKRFGDHWIVSTIDDNGWPGAHAVRVDTRTARTALVPCPEDKIHCGMERPTVSDGRRVYQDVHLGLSAVFPASSAVCTARGHDGEPLGFYAMVRAPEIPCETVDESTQMGVEVARSRPTVCAELHASSAPWRPLSPETSRLFSGQRPTLGGLPSMACELHNGDDVAISVHASTASGHNPGTTYQAYVMTTPLRLAEDIQAFELFLKNVRIGTAAGEQTD